MADENLDEDAAYRRYLLFKDVKFGVVPKVGVARILPGLAAI